MKTILKPVLLIGLVAVSLALYSFFERPSTPEYKLRLTEGEIINIVNAVKRSDFLSAKDANALADKVIQQANDTTLNPRSIPDSIKKH